jgi:hypothetical protein
MAAYFPEISKIAYEGPKSKNPLAFKHYNPEEMIEGQSMKDLFRFSVAYWHTFRGTGSDPFGSATLSRPWDDGSSTVANALKRVDVAFEFMSKLQAPFYCWHDRDVAPEASTLKETNKNFDEIAKNSQGVKVYRLTTVGGYQAVSSDATDGKGNCTTAVGTSSKDVFVVQISIENESAPEHADSCAATEKVAALVVQNLKG